MYLYFILPVPALLRRSIWRVKLKSRGLVFVILCSVFSFFSSSVNKRTIVDAVELAKHARAVGWEGRGPIKNKNKIIKM